jgi:beta-lactamase regulating signal transducer with metallopeptidase domain
VQDLFGLLFSLPTESVAVRAAVGSLAGVLITAFLLRSVLRIPRVRSAAALIPIGAIVGAIIVSWGELQLPMIMTSSDAEYAYGPFLVHDTYMHFAPLAWPLLAIWAGIAGLRVTRRLVAMRRMRVVAASGAPSRDLRVTPLLHDVAARLGVPTPRLVIVRDCPGGAALVGIHSPTIVIDADVLAALDDHELEGLLAHELSHVRRRDNLLALVVGLVRDACFFVPGGRWVSRRLCAERELAADHLAISATRRPCALASGLLKTMDVSRPGMVCASFAAPSAVVMRVERLVSDTPGGGRTRTVMETGLVAATLTAVVALAIQIPAVVASNAEDNWNRDALALLWTWPVETQTVVAVGEAAVFDVYRRSTPYLSPPRTVGTGLIDAGREFHPAFLRGEHTYADSAGVHTRGTEALAAMRDAESRQWRATPLVSANDGLGVFWLHAEVATLP